MEFHQDCVWRYAELNHGFCVFVSYGVRLPNVNAV